MNLSPKFRIKAHVRFAVIIAASLPLVLSQVAKATNEVSSVVSFDVNDVSFLWPVPKNKADVDALISMDDTLADGVSKVWPEDLFQQVIATALNVRIGHSQITFPNPALTNLHAWKVAGIRVNPASLGASPGMLAKVPEIPGVRLIVQPVTVNGDGVVEVHDFAAHVVFNFVLSSTNGNPQFFRPDEDAFRSIVNDLKKTKALVESAHVSTRGPLDVHPGFRSNVPGFRESLRDFLKTHLSRKRFQVVSFMGIQSPEPWIFFSVARTPDGPFVPRTVGGFATPRASETSLTASVTSQMLIFRGGPPVVPAPQIDAQTGEGISTALLFGEPDDALRKRSDAPLFAGATNTVLNGMKLRDVADLIANPQRRNTFNADCVSCHTETTRGRDLNFVSVSPGIAFRLPEGVSGVADAVLPEKSPAGRSWNVRNFGWFPGATVPTVTRRAANEAAESADFINRKYLGQAALSDGGQPHP